MSDWVRILTEEIRELRKENTQDHKNLQLEINTLQRFKWKAIGGLAAILFLVEIAVQIIKMKGV